MTLEKPHLFAAILVTSLVTASVAQAQFTNAVRGPNININVGPRVSVNPNIHYSPNLNIDSVERGTGDSPRRVRPKSGSPKPDKDGPRTAKRDTAPIDISYVKNEVLLELAAGSSESQREQIAKRHRLTPLQSQDVPLLNSTLVRWKISDGRSVDAVVKEVSGDGDIKSAQRNSIFKLQDDAKPPKSQTAPPEQYAVNVMHLIEAHTLSVGANVRVAIIDSGIDQSHPEIAGSVEGAYDALGSSEGPHAHGTGIASLIAGHDRLTGAAPAVRLLAIRAFGEKKSGAESTSFVVIKGLDYAVANDAKVINMSFAGPHDQAIEKALSAAAGKGIVLVAAAGNGGPKSVPLYPGADRNVIAVTATDASHQLFGNANRGDYVAVAAPGVSILGAVPDGKYGVSSGTSLSAAFVSGVAALMIANRPGLSPDDARAALAQSAHDLGAPGKDAEFGAGEADAYAAVAAISVPIATASGRPGAAQ